MSPVGPVAEYIDVAAKHGCIVLTPVRVNRAGAVRAKLAGANTASDLPKDRIA